MHYTAGRRPRSEARDALLRALGALVRVRRAELGLTMRALGARAGVSERFLAQLEGGEGNISVARLEDVAEALGTTGGELLSSASHAQRSAASSSRPVLALVGLRGAGKISVGAEVASARGVPFGVGAFVELDELIAREAQMTLPSIFEIHGERYYRAVEREVLRRLLDQGKSMVVATGGSIVTDAQTWSLLRERARTVWLKARPEDHWDRVVAQGDVRPMRGRPRAMNELRQLLGAREPLYQQADVVVDTSSGSLEDVVREVLQAAQAPGARGAA